jgi:glucose uptake protein GlcU
MKKTLAVLVGVIVILIMIVGCATTSTTTSNNEPAYNTQEFRMLMLQANPHLPPTPAWVD